jgi:hypothetical protein
MGVGSMIDINYDIKTGKTTQRDFTPDEIAELEATQLKVKEKQIEIAAKAIAKAALLKKLGITEDEARLLLS